MAINPIVLGRTGFADDGAGVWEEKCGSGSWRQCENVWVLDSPASSLSFPQTARAILALLEEGGVHGAFSPGPPLREEETEAQGNGGSDLLGRCSQLMEKLGLQSGFSPPLPVYAHCLFWSSEVFPG